MEIAMQRTADDARFWNRIARWYAANPVRDAAGYERTLDRTIHYLSGADTVLEFGCGTGTTALRLAPHVSRIVATDISSAMIEIAQEKAAAQSCPNAEFAVATPDLAPGPEGSFDAVLAFNLVHLFADRPSMLARVRQLLKPGGLFVSKTPCLTEMTRLIRVAVPVMRFFGKAPSHVAFLSAAELESEVEGAGFTIVERARHGSTRKDPRIFIVARANQQ
jgi:ubiquinone/menaquinone biosynthesis C-methylase UbiE